MDALLFYLFGGIAVLAALSVLVQRRVFYSAISLIVCLSALSGLYMLLEAPFIAAVQVIVYAGAIMVLFLFVIMLLDPFSAGEMKDKKKSLAYVGVLLGAVGLILMFPVLGSYDLGRTPRNPEIIVGGPGSVQNLGRVLFADYLLPFEATSILILVAIIGAVVLAKRQS